MHQEENNVWKSKQLQVPSNNLGTSQLGRPGIQRGGVCLSTSAPGFSDKKGFNDLKRRQLLDFLTKTKPNTVMWDKSCKYNKSLPPPQEGAPAVLEWGKCWIFATKQPYSEDGKTWLNGPNKMDPQSLHLCSKPDYSVEKSQWQNVDLPTEDWKMSWKKCDKNHKEGAAPGHEGNYAKSGLFSLMDETQHNDVMTEWVKSWRAIKPASQMPNCDQINESVAANQNVNRELNSGWECWRLVNHHGLNRSNLSQTQKHYSAEWADSWRAAVVVFNNRKNSGSSLSHDHTETSDDPYQQRESRFNKVLLVNDKLKRRDEFFVLCDEFKVLSEWAKSWQVTKNNSKPCEEMEKILKASLSRTEAALQKAANNNRHFSAPEQTDSSCNQRGRDEIYHPKREFTRFNKLYQKQHNDVLSAAEWRDSWKSLKSRIRMEKGRMRNDPFKSFGSFEKERDTKWADSLKFTPQSLRQEPESWQQHWPTLPPMRVDRVGGQNHFAPVELPKNGPTGEHSWAGSWKSSSPQYRPEPRHSGTQSGYVPLSSHNPEDSARHWSVRHRGYAGAVVDWQGAWMVANTQSRQDRPSLARWMEAWKWSLFNTENWAEQLSRRNEVDELMEIRPVREKGSLQRVATKMSQSFNINVFNQRYPEKQWSDSWRAGSLMNHQEGLYRISAAPRKGGDAPQQLTDNGHGSKWGLPFRIANPMPHVEQPWVECCSNPYHYAATWTRKSNTQANLNTTFTSNYAAVKFWANSYQFRQGNSARMAQKGGGKEPVDPMEIVTRKSKPKSHHFAKIEKEKQSERKWAGCHLLGKTQPRPKRGPASVKKLKMEDNSKFLEEWAESWRYLIGSSVLKRMSVKSLSGWTESWKFLLPLYQPMNGPKAK